MGTLQSEPQCTSCATPGSAHDQLVRGCALFAELGSSFTDSWLLSLPLSEELARKAWKSVWSHVNYLKYRLHCIEKHPKANLCLYTISEQKLIKNAFIFPQDELLHLYLLRRCLLFPQFSQMRGCPVFAVVNSACYIVSE